MVQLLLKILNHNKNNRHKINGQRAHRKDKEVHNLKERDVILVSKHKTQIVNKMHIAKMAKKVLRDREMVHHNEMYRHPKIKKDLNNSHNNNANNQKENIKTKI